MKTTAYICNFCWGLFQEKEIKSGLKPEGDIFKVSAIIECKPKDSDKHLCVACYERKVTRVVNLIMEANEIRPGVHRTEKEITDDYRTALFSFVWQNKQFKK